MSKFRWYFLLMAPLLVSQCSVMKNAQLAEKPELLGVEDMAQKYISGDSIHSILISKAEAILTFDNERYEVGLTLYSKRDSIIYLSAVNSGFEILRASVKRDSIKVINRLEKIVYSAPLERKFGYQYPVSFDDLQNLISNYYLSDYLVVAKDNQQNSIVFEFDESYIKKRIVLNRVDLSINIFEFYHQKTDRYLLGERKDDSFKIYSNFMITDFEIVTRGGDRTYNRDIKIKMRVNPRKYTFTELR